MANTIEVKVPDIGGYDDVPVIEVLVAVGDTVARDQGLVTLESDKATMEVPSSAAGRVVELKVKVGDKLSEGSVVAVLEAQGEQATAPSPAKPTDKPTDKPADKPEASAPAAKAPAPAAAPATAAAPAPSAKAAPASGRKADVECRMLVLGAGPGGYTAAFR